MSEKPPFLDAAAAAPRAKELVERYLQEFAPLLANPYVVADRASLGCRRMDMRQHFLAVWHSAGADPASSGLKPLAQCLSSLAQFQPGIGEGFLDLVHDNLAPSIAARIRQAVDRDRLRFAMSLPAEEQSPERVRAA